MVATRSALAYETGVADVEGVQDIVEMCLMKSGYYDVGRAYILYRERHAQLRDEKRTETLKKIDEGKLFVTNSKKRGSSSARQRSGGSCPRPAGLRGRSNVEELLQACEVSVYDGMPTEEIAQLAVLTARGLIETNPVYDIVTCKDVPIEHLQGGLRRAHKAGRPEDRLGAGVREEHKAWSRDGQAGQGAGELRPGVPAQELEPEEGRAAALQGPADALRQVLHLRPRSRRGTPRRPRCSG